MSEYVVMIGLPGSGKSTWIKAHMEKNPDKNYRVVSSDDIIEEHATEKGLTYDEVFHEHQRFAIKEMNRRLKEYIKNGDNIIHDQTNMGAKKRKGIINNAKGYDVSAVVFALTDVEWKRRYDSRANQGKTIPDHVLKSMASRYEAPTKSEGFGKITYVRD